MSATRDKAREIIDKELPEGAVYTSNGPHAQKYAELTGYTHKTLTDNWEKFDGKPGGLTGCNAFVGWYASKMGSKSNLGGFDLKGLVLAAKKGESWIPSTKDRRPKYGDILRHTAFHVDIAIGFDGERLRRAAAGQGGPKKDKNNKLMRLSNGTPDGADAIKRVTGTAAYDHTRLVGWIDIDIYFGDSEASSTLVPDAGWLMGWWDVKDRGDTYYYYFFPNGLIQYTKNSAMLKKCPNLGNEESGRFSIDQYRNIRIKWNMPENPVEIFSPSRDDKIPRRLSGSFPDYPGSFMAGTKRGP